MNVNIDQMDHVFDTIDGFESISNKDFKSPNSVYAQTVLKLNGADLGVISGQEGFGTAVKAGAKKVYEMIMNFLRAVKEFFFGTRSGKSDASLSKVIAQIPRSTFVIKAAPNHKLEKLLEEANASNAKLESILSGRYGSVRFASYDEFLDVMTENTQASLRKLDLTGLSITNLGDTEGYKTDKLREELEKLIKMIANHESGKGQDGSIIALFKAVEDGQAMANTLGSVRTEAKKLIVTMTADLEIATQALNRNKQFVDKDENLTKQHERLEAYTIQLGKSMAKLVKLSKDCENYILNIADVCVKMEAKVSGNDSNGKQILAEFDKLMLDDGDVSFK
ncbi:hypothetical protein CF8_0090 [Aeromonas phage CF8]|nr:hypothetical protein CF8_0090 [Aeromonas phage CF8]